MCPFRRSSKLSQMVTMFSEANRRNSFGHPPTRALEVHPHKIKLDAME